MSEPVEIRCTCRVRPLLGKALRDAQGKWYLHIKVYRQQRIYAEIIADSGTVRVKCRECLCWHTIKIRHYSNLGLEVKEERLPSAIFLP